MTEPAVLSIEAMSAGYTGLDVVRRLQLEVRSGEIVALLGPNGAGKSTTLRAVSGLCEVSAGEIRVNGASVTNKRPHRIARLGVAHVTEDRSLLTTMTVVENLRVGDRKGKPDLSVVLRYFPALERILDRRVGLLSGGEQQMVAIGRALMAEPKLLMIDEMSLGLAPLIVANLLPVIRHLATEQGAAVLLVEQHVKLALDHVDRAYVLVHGEMILEDSARRLRDNPHLLEAAYLGPQELAG